jgi:7-keto-8-aminopelargonate synthetase-like enzyme
MAKLRSFHFSRTRSLESVERYLNDGLGDGVLWHQSRTSLGRSVDLSGRDLLNFGSCSYLGLHLRPELKEGAASAIERYGTQFSISRVFQSCDLYAELEASLCEMTGRHVLVTPTTTLAHQAALQSLVADRDAVIIDQFAHASLHLAVELLGTTYVTRVRHSLVDQLEGMVAELSRQHERVWYVLDGLYSMGGEFAPFSALASLLDRFPSLHLYVDDAHSTGWYGEKGRGAALTHLPKDDRVVVALSLNKSFSAAGGALVFATPEMVRRVRLRGGTLTFSGPIQPPMLGAAVASARLHLSAELPHLQAELRSRIDRALLAAERESVQILAHDHTPIFFLPHDSPVEARGTARAFWKRGFYVCPVHFPAVPMNLPGIRFTVSLLNEPQDIDALMDVAKDLKPASCTEVAAGA